MSAALGVRLGIDKTAIAALGDVFERWDGRGIPDGRAGDQLDPVARIVHVAEQAVLAHFSGGEAAARNDVARRAGGQLDPDLCAQFSQHCDEVLGALDSLVPWLDSLSLMTSNSSALRHARLSRPRCNRKVCRKPVVEA